MLLGKLRAVPERNNQRTWADNGSYRLSRRGRYYGQSRCFVAGPCYHPLRWFFAGRRSLVRIAGGIRTRLLQREATPGDDPLALCRGQAGRQRNAAHRDGGVDPDRSRGVQRLIRLSGRLRCGARGILCNCGRWRLPPPAPRLLRPGAAVSPVSQRGPGHWTWPRPQAGPVSGNRAASGIPDDSPCIGTRLPAPRLLRPRAGRGQGQVSHGSRRPARRPRHYDHLPREPRDEPLDITVAE